MTQHHRIAILSPVFNDWQSATILLRELDHVLKSSAMQIDVDLYFIDDGSTQGDIGIHIKEPCEFLKQVILIELGRNLGNQRALAIGLAHLSTMDYDSVLLMDSDGEDSPADVPRLIEEHLKLPGMPLVFAKRTRRSERLSFRLGYQIYKFLYRLLTGKKIFFGNFSIVRIKDVKRLVLHSELWSHYPATVLKARIPWVFIDTTRAKRYQGQSSTNWVSLAVHGLSGVSAYLDDVGVRSIMASLATMGIGTIGVLAIAYERIFTNLAIPGWASIFGLSFIHITFQAFIGSLLMSFFILNNRTNIVHTPLHNTKQFILRVTTMYHK
jgi:polyisoprenyl-phosphate glycosyltransferase